MEEVGSLCLVKVLAEGEVDDVLIVFKSHERGFREVLCNKGQSLFDDG